MQLVLRCVALVSLFTVCLSQNVTDRECGGKERAGTLLDVSREFINKAKSMYPNCVGDALNCGKKEKSLAFLDVSLNMISQVKKDFPVCPEPKCPDSECPDSKCPDPKCPDPVCPDEKQLARPMDCGEILKSGEGKSGVYSIWPRSRISANEPLSVYCDMDTDGGGWTVIQRRGQYSNPKDYFFKGWEDYKNGFGNITEEFWIGNDNIYSISNQANYSIRFDLKDHTGDIGHAVYDTFWIEDEEAQYKLHIKGYSGNVGDNMITNNNMKFSTKDRKNDKWSGSNACAWDRQGAWWYEACTNVNLNGLNQPGVNSDKGITWWSWKHNFASFSWTEMKLRS